MFGFISKKKLLKKIESLQEDVKCLENRDRSRSNELWEHKKRMDKIVGNRDYQANLIAEKLGYTIQKVPADVDFLLKEIPKPVRVIRKKKKKKTTKK
jgi:hypothetical protein